MTKAKTELRVVEPDLSEIERVLSEAADLKQPLVLESSTVRELFVKELRRHEQEREAQADELELFERQMAAVVAAKKALIADKDTVIGFYRSGLAPEV